MVNFDPMAIPVWIKIVRFAFDRFISWLKCVFQLLTNSSCEWLLKFILTDFCITLIQ